MAASSYSKWRGGTFSLSAVKLEEGLEEESCDTSATNQIANDVEVKDMDFKWIKCDSAERNESIPHNFEASSSDDKLQRLRLLFVAYSLFTDSSMFHCPISEPKQFVQCPGCSIKYRGPFDGMLRLLGHIKKAHEQRSIGRYTYLIEERYRPLIEIAKKPLKWMLDLKEDHESKSVLSPPSGNKNAFFLMERAEADVPQPCGNDGWIVASPELGHDLEVISEALKKEKQRGSVLQSTIVDLKSNADEMRAQNSKLEAKIDTLQRLNLRYQEHLLNTLSVTKVASGKDIHINASPTQSDFESDDTHILEVDEGVDALLRNVDENSTSSEPVAVSEPEDEDQVQSDHSGVATCRQVEIHRGIFVDARAWTEEFKSWLMSSTKCYAAGSKGDKEFVKDAALHLWGVEKLKSHSISGKQANANMFKDPNCPPPGPKLPLFEILAVQSALKRRLAIERAQSNSLVDEELETKRLSLSKIKFLIGQKRNSLKRQKKNR